MSAEPFSARPDIVARRPDGPRLPTNLPPPELRSAFPRLATACDEFERLGTQLRAAHEALRVAESGLRAAQHADIAAAAVAVRDGKPDPGDREVTKARQRIADCQRQVAILTTAQRTAAADLSDIILGEREVYLAATQATIGKVRTKLRATVAQWAEQRARLATKVAFVGWLERWPRKPSFEATPQPRIRLGRGDAFLLDEILRALESDAASESAHVPEQDEAA